MTEGFDAAPGSGLWQYYVYIDATIVPEPPVTHLGLVALASLCAIRSWRGLPAALKFYAGNPHLRQMDGREN